MSSKEMSMARFHLSFMALATALILFTSSLLASPLSIPDTNIIWLPVPGTGAVKRDGNADDATDPTKVLTWLQANVDFETDRAVFYSGSTVGGLMAKAFCEANEDDGYKWYFTIFDNDFSAAFGGADPTDTDVARACSEAFGKFAQEETRVSNDAGGNSFEYWTE